MPEIKVDKKPIVLKELARHGNKARAARVANVTTETIRRWCREDAEFKGDLAQAMAIGAG